MMYFLSVIAFTSVQASPSHGNWKTKVLECDLSAAAGAKIRTLRQDCTDKSTKPCQKVQVKCPKNMRIKGQRRRMWRFDLTGTDTLKSYRHKKWRSDFKCSTVCESLDTVCSGKLKFVGRRNPYAMQCAQDGATLTIDGSEYSSIEFKRSYPKNKWFNIPDSTNLIGCHQIKCTEPITTKAPTVTTKAPTETGKAFWAWTQTTTGKMGGTWGCTPASELFGAALCSEDEGTLKMWGHFFDRMTYAQNEQELTHQDYEGDTICPRALVDEYFKDSEDPKNYDQNNLLEFEEFWKKKMLDGNTRRVWSNEACTIT